MSEQPHDINPTTGEVVPYTGELVEGHPRRTRSELAMMDRATDSWTIVLEDVGLLAGRIAATEFVPKPLRGNGVAVAAVILHGRELGLPPMTSLALTHVVEGRPALTAEGMRAMILEAGHELRFSESSSTTCTILGRRQGQQDWTPVTWTIADAQRAGVAGKQVWKNYPRAMLQARATTELARMIFPDVVHGMRSVEELEDMTGAADEQTPAEPTTRVARKRAEVAPRAIAAPAEAASEPEHPPAPPAPRKTAPPPARAPQTAGDGRETTPAPAAGGSDVPPAAAEPGEPAPEQTPPAQVDERPELEQPPAEQTEPAPPVQETPARERKMTGSQRASIMAQFARLGLGDDRDTRLLYTQTLAQRDEPLATSNDLTFDQASRVIDALAKLRDRDALDKAVSA